MFVLPSIVVLTRIVLLRVCMDCNYYFVLIHNNYDLMHNKSSSYTTMTGISVVLILGVFGP